MASGEFASVLFFNWALIAWSVATLQSLFEVSPGKLLCPVGCILGSSRQWAHELRRRGLDLFVSVARRSRCTRSSLTCCVAELCAGQSGVEHWHHPCAAGARLCIHDGCDRLLFVQGAELVNQLQHVGGVCVGWLEYFKRENGKPKVFYSNQGSQFTSVAVTDWKIPSCGGTEAGEVRIENELALQDVKTG